MMRKRVILYNPKAVFGTMPLALLAVGSALDRSRYEVIIIDGRFETDPLQAVLAKVTSSTICLGITVLTGTPIGDALTISRAVKANHPLLPALPGQRRKVKGQNMP